MSKKKPWYSRSVSGLRDRSAGNGKRWFVYSITVSVFLILVMRTIKIPIPSRITLTPNSTPSNPFHSFATDQYLEAMSVCLLKGPKQEPPAWIEIYFSMSGEAHEIICIDRVNKLRQVIQPKFCRQQNCQTREYLHSAAKMLQSASRSETDVVVLSRTDINSPRIQLDIYSLQRMVLRDPFRAIAYPDADFGISDKVIVTSAMVLYHLQNLTVDACLNVEGTSLFYRCLFQLLCVHVDILDFDFSETKVTKHTEVECKQVKGSDFISLEAVTKADFCKQDCHLSTLEKYPNTCGLLSKCANLENGWKYWSVQNCGTWHEGDGPNIPLSYVNLVLKPAALNPPPPKWLSTMNPGDLLCTAVIPPKSRLIPSVLEMLKGCDHFLLFSNSSVEYNDVDHSVISWNGSMQVPYGGKFHSALNTPIFLKMYFDWLANNIHKPVWIAKVDPDTVLVPCRLRQALNRSGYNPRSPIMSGTGCGPLEVLSTGALRKYLEIKDRCEKKTLFLYPQEDLYMEYCFKGTSTQFTKLEFNKHGILAIELDGNRGSFAGMERECKRRNSSYTFGHPFKNEYLHKRLVELCSQACLS